MPDLPASFPERTRKRKFRRQRGYHRRVASAIYVLQMREAVLRLKHEGYTDIQIAEQLGQTPATIKKYRKDVMDEGPKALPPPKSGPDREPRYKRRVPSSGESGSTVRMEIIPGPDVIALRASCLSLRKRAMPFDLIALELGISVTQAREHTAAALREISDSVTTHAELERRLMVEQIDDMVRAAYLQATDPQKPNFDAQDRMIKLLDRKAKLLGLDQVPSQDIKIKLQQLAQEGNYDISELEDIAKVVLARHRFKITDPSSGEEVS